MFDLIESDIPAFPVVARGKTPITARGFKDASADPEQKRRWQIQHPGCNWGIPTGAGSRLVVVDVDPRAGGAESLKALLHEFGDFPATWFVSTGGGGSHYYFLHPGGVIPCSSGKVAPGIDIKADGGYVVAPPSIHLSGNPYVWDIEGQPGICDLAPMPAWILDRIMAHKPSPPLADGDTIPEGRREQSLASMAGALRRRGATENEIHAALIEINKRCVPPLPEKDVARVARSISRYEPKDAPAGDAPRRLIIHTADELGEMEIPARDYILEPWLRAKDLAMVYAKRGVGKTWISNGIAIAIASGTPFLGWIAPKMRSVLLVDGEMQADALRTRMRILAECAGGIALPPDLRILANDLQEVGGLPNLADPGGQALIEQVIGSSEVLIFDNISTLCRGGVENEAESWEAVQVWLVELRRRGLTVLLVHHAGHSGSQRGTTKREDILDTSISLERPEDYDPEQGARFLLKFTKARALHGAVAETLDVRLVQDQGGMTWSYQPSAKVRRELAAELRAAGMTQRQVAKEVGVSAKTICLWEKGALGLAT